MELSWIQRFWKHGKISFKEETKKHSLVKFSLLFVTVIVYLLFVSFKFGAGNGFLITILTWSFFVFCTPIADAGFILDFPNRLITGMRMVHSEMIVWGIAFSVNVLTLLFNPEVYSKTLILYLFHHILSQPFPYWGIILLSAVGTFLSVFFGDELIDVSTHKQREKYHKHMDKYRIIIFVSIILLALILYDFLLNTLGVNIPLL